MTKSSRASSISYQPAPQYEESQVRPVPLWRRGLKVSLGRCVLVLCVTFTAWIGFQALAGPYGVYEAAGPRSSSSPDGLREDGVVVEANATKVALEAHIMSKCPDARDCLQKLIVPAMEQIHDKVDFRLSYIGTYDPSSDEVNCMHGPSECLGNMILLCAQALYPEPVISLGFANCLLASYRQIPERQLIEDCALEHGVSFQKVNQCISDDGGEGVQLLRDSIDRSERAGVTTSCTVRLQGQMRCIRDGGRWTDCDRGSTVDQLVEDVNTAWEKLQE